MNSLNNYNDILIGRENLQDQFGPGGQSYDVQSSGVSHQRTMP